MRWTLQSPSGGTSRVDWQDVRAQMQPGDELWTYERYAEREYKSRSSAGFALVRHRKVFAYTETHLERHSYPLR